MKYTINVRGQLVDLSSPVVMGILNATPDSFYSGSRKQTETEIADRANQIIAEGGKIIDVGAFSTRPGAEVVSVEEETQRLKRALAIVRREQPDAIVSGRHISSIGCTPMCGGVWCRYNKRCVGRRTDRYCGSRDTRGR